MVVDSEDEAREILDAEYPDAYFLDEYQPVNSRHEKMLVWENEEQSQNDDGSNAVAEIRREITPTQNDEN